MNIRLLGCLLVGSLPGLLPAGPLVDQDAADLAATDAIGRKLPGYQEAGPLRKDKFVGLFYWTWHTQTGKNGPPSNVAEYLRRAPEAREVYDHPVWPKPDGIWFWSEPLFGYYRSDDPWVLRKHAEMLADAAVDVIVFDCTNANHTWKESYLKLCEVFTAARQDGVRTPQIAFMLPFGPTEGGKQILHELYADLYQPHKYQDLWFRWKGKPLLLGTAEFCKIPRDQPADPRLEAELAAFFTFRPVQPKYDLGPQEPTEWGWLEIYPQHGFAPTPGGGFEQVPVGVAQNWSATRRETAMNAPGVFDRSYTHHRGQVTEPGAVNHGYNFQEQWDRARAIDPELIFITGWNEWIVGRQKYWKGQFNAFPDEFNQEASRDVEPMQGGHADNYYYQMVANIRRFKGLPPPQPVSPPTTIVIDGKFEQWAAITPRFTAHRGSTLHRDHLGYGNLHYVNRTGRNDIVLARVARDEANVYFYVETAVPLTAASDPHWMRLFIDVDRDKNTGWEGYDLVINRLNPGARAIAEWTGTGWNWQPAGEVDYAVAGNQLELRIPKSLLHITGEPDFEFKWSDNMQQEGDIMDFWINGDAAPAGRFNFHYQAPGSTRPPPGQTGLRQVGDEQSRQDQTMN